MLATAGRVMLITSLPREAWVGSRILELYRRRWQVELVFKRLKSLIGLEELRVHDNELVRVWIHAVLLVALLIDAERPSLTRERPDSPPSANHAEDTSPSGVCRAAPPWPDRHRSGNGSVMGHSVRQIAAPAERATTTTALPRGHRPE
jgi:hypothetical protein